MASSNSSERPSSRAAGGRQRHAGEADLGRIRNPAHRQRRDPPFRDGRGHRARPAREAGLRPRRSRVRRPDDRVDPDPARPAGYRGRLRPRRLPPDDGPGRGPRRDVQRDRPELQRRLRAPDPGRGRVGTAAAACRDRGAGRRHRRGDPAAPRQLPPRDGAVDRVLPHAGKPRPDPRRPQREPGVRGDPASVGAGAGVIVRKSQAEIDGMARAGELVAETIALVGEHIQPGITTGELDRIGEEFIREHGGVPTSKGYKGFPAALCISPNSMVVHGIPGEYRAQEGDLISVDLGVTLNGLVADSAVTLPVGEIDAEAQRLLDVCQEALTAAIEQARVGNRLSDISHAVQIVVEEAGFSVVRSLVGHGVGRSYHEEPQIPNYGPPGRGPLLQEGMTLAIEPMITAGGPDVYVHEDDWSISSVDESLAAHFEHSVAVTADGPRILTV